MLKKMRVLFIVFATLVVFSGVANAFEGTIKTVDIKVDGKVVSVNTTRDTVSQVLADQSITVSKDDVLTPVLSAAVTDKMLIEIKKAFMVTVNVDGSPRHLKVSDGTLKSAKDKIELGIKTPTKLVGANETDRLVPNMTIELVTSYTEKDEEEKEIPFEVVYVENGEVDEGIETVLTEGVPGVSVTVYESLFEGEGLVSRLPVETIVKSEPINKVIERGTKPLVPVMPVVPHEPEKKLTYSKVLTMRASAYTSDRGDSGTHTATGERARIGLVAVDPNFIPLGTLLYVENYGLCRAADTGGMIKGDAIDLYFDKYEECVNFGRRNVTVYVLTATSEEIMVMDIDFDNISLGAA